MADEIQTWTVQKMLEWSGRFFSDYGMDSPQLDAQILLGHVLGMSRIELIIHGQRPLDAGELASYKKLVIRRAKGREPVAYILGEKEFWSMPLRVTPDVLIPRPDTECLVERALQFLRACRDQTGVPWSDPGEEKHLTYEAVDARKAYYRELAEQENVEPVGDEPDAGDEGRAGTSGVTAVPDDAHVILKVLDVGTGSGAIALALARETAGFCNIFALDVSPRALEVARGNAESLGMNVGWIQSDLFERVEEDRFNLIVSNPPYVTRDEMGQLAPEVLREPRVALEAGPDGLDIYRRLIPEAYNRLLCGGALMLEIGSTRQQDVHALMDKAGFARIRMFKDYGGLPRIMVGIREV